MKISRRQATWEEEHDAPRALLTHVTHQEPPCMWATAWKLRVLLSTVSHRSSSLIGTNSLSHTEELGWEHLERSRRVGECHY